MRSHYDVLRAVMLGDVDRTFARWEGPHGEYHTIFAIGVQEGDAALLDVCKRSREVIVWEAAKVLRDNSAPHYIRAAAKRAMEMA